MFKERGLRDWTSYTIIPWSPRVSVVLVLLVIQKSRTWINSGKEIEKTCSCYISYLTFWNKKISNHCFSACNTIKFCFKFLSLNVIVTFLKLFILRTLLNISHSNPLYFTLLTILGYSCKYKYLKKDSWHNFRIAFLK